MSNEQQAQQLREEVLSEFGTWRVTADPDAPAAEEVRTLETLLRLKAEKLDSPDPGMWTADLAAELLTEVVPRSVIQPREQKPQTAPKPSAAVPLKRDDRIEVPRDGGSGR